MREIKFRVWYPYEWDGETDKPIKFKMSYDWAFEEYAPINDLLNSFDDDHKIMQYTGLKDKNSKEIYEGDIVDLQPDQNDKIWHMVIEYDTAAFHCRAIHTSANHPLHFHKYAPDKKWVVIGNIYENPELI